MIVRDLRWGELSRTGSKFNKEFSIPSSLAVMEWTVEFGGIGSLPS
jgi:hypothetical protein